MPVCLPCGCLRSLGASALLALLLGFGIAFPRVAHAQVFITSDATITNKPAGDTYYVGQDKSYKTLPGTVTLTIAPTGDVSTSTLYAYGSHHIDISGQANYVNLLDSSVANVSAGNVNHLQPVATATVNLSGGAATYVYAAGSSTVNVTGGTVTTYQGVGASINNIYGGRIDSSNSDSLGTFNVYGGSFGFLRAAYATSYNVYGGTFSSPFRLLQNSTLSVYGSGLSSAFVSTGGDSDGAYNAYLVTGTLQNGQRIDDFVYDYRDGGLSVGDPYTQTGALRFYTVTTAAAPEPSSIGLLVAAGALVTGRIRSKRRRV